MFANDIVILKSKQFIHYNGKRFIHLFHYFMKMDGKLLYKFISNEKC